MENAKGKSMKYFTKEWCFGNLTDEATEEKIVQYNEYINNIYTRLPVSLKILVKGISLHDGIINKVKFANNVLTLYGIFGNLQTGYFFLTIKYLEVLSLNKEALEFIFNNKKIEILNDEFEKLDENNYLHKLFFASKQEIEIPFRDVAIEIQNTFPDNYKKSYCKFEVI